MTRAKVPASVFLNVPYDEAFEPLFLAYIVGITQLGLRIQVTLAVSGISRLATVIRLIDTSEYSIHDLSRIESSQGIPRFNMPLELGLALYRSQLPRRRNHAVHLFESVRYRAQRSTSDVNGMDPQIHGNSPQGVMKGLRNLFSQLEAGTTVQEMMATYRAVLRKLPELRYAAGGTSLFERALFQDVVLAASLEHQKNILARRGKAIQPKSAPQGR